MPSVRARLDALAAQLRAQAGTAYQDLDPVSQALVDCINELDTPEKRAACCVEYSMTPEELDTFLRAIKTDY